MKARKLLPHEQATLDAMFDRLSHGDGIALFEALTLCWERGWQVPRWIHNALLVGLQRFNNKRVVEFGEALNMAAHPARVETNLRARLKIVDAVTGRPREQVLRKPLSMEGAEFITMEERAVRLAYDHDDATVARRAGLSTSIVRRIRKMHGIKDISARKVRRSQ